MSAREEKRTVFRRIRGRIVPITISVAGAGIAADAARSTVVRTDKLGNYSVKRTHALMPMSLAKGELRLGTSITSYNKFGQKRGGISFLKNVMGEGEIDWLSVKRKFRGVGVSKQLTHDAAAEMRHAGIKKISSHVAHPRSAKLFGDKVKSTYYKSYYTSKSGESFVNQIGKKKAMELVGAYKWKSKSNTTAAVFRDVKIPKLRRMVAPFKSAAIKGRIGLGLGLVGLGLYLGNRE